MRALIVDDDPAITRMLVRCLALWGWETDACHAISVALALFRDGRYDLALCDVDLPDGDGVLLSRALMTTKPSLKIVVISGNPENLRRARDCGLAACLRKPFELDELRALIDVEPAEKS